MGTLSFQPFFPQSFQTEALQITNSTGTSTSNVVQGGTNGTKIEAISATNTDTIDHALLISLNVGGTLYAMANINVPANSGNLTVLPVNILGNSSFASYAPQDMNGNKYFYLANNTVALTASSNSGPGTGKFVNVIVQAGNY